jgi:hypothetical protein
MVRTVDDSKDSKQTFRLKSSNRKLTYWRSRNLSRINVQIKKKLVIFEVHYIWYRRKSYNTGPEQGHINCLVYILMYEKTNKSCGLQTERFYVSDGISPMEVLETMRNLIVEL